MEKKKIRRETGEISFEAGYASENTPIDTVWDWMALQKSLGATEILFTGSGWDGSVDEVTLSASYDELESDVDYLARQEKERESIIIQQELQLEKDKQQYLKLKERFEK